MFSMENIIMFIDFWVILDETENQIYSFSSSK